MYHSGNLKYIEKHYNSGLKLRMGKITKTVQERSPFNRLKSLVGEDFQIFEQGEIFVFRIYFQ